MTTPAPQPQQAASQTQPAQQAGQQAGAHQTAQQASQPAQASQQAPANQAAPDQAPAAARQAPTSSTPRRLRAARTLAAGAALLTGLVGTGTFATDGLNATPNVVAQHWVAAERAGVEMAHADLLAAERLSGTTTDETEAAYDEAVRSVSADLTSLSSGDDGASSAATRWADFVVGAERGVAQGQAGSSTYAEASAAAQEAIEGTDTLAASHAQDLRTGSRSLLTAIVGSLATMILIGVMLWLALATHRMINVPLLLATLVTAGLTYVSFNPQALPVEYDTALAASAQTADELQELYQDRRAVVAGELGLDVEAPSQDSRATTAEDFQAAEEELRAELDSRLDASSTTIGRPAVLTSGAALLLGLIAAALAWSGIGQRLRDYR